MVHNSHMIAAQPRISWPVFTKLLRLCGADQTLTPTYWSSIPMVSLEEGIRCQHVAAGPLLRVQEDVVHAGGGDLPGAHPDPRPGVRKGHHHPVRRRHARPPRRLHGRRPGLAAGDRRGDAGRSDDGDARKGRRTRPCRRAIEKWGYLERPKTPWLRVAPKFHPKPFKMDEKEV